MRTTYCLFVLLLVTLSACSTSSHGKTPRDPSLIIYHVKRGSEADLELLLARAWEIYKKEGMVFSEPHVRVQAHENDEHDRFIEIFLWRGYYATEYPPEPVKALWKQMELLCEPRNGHLAIEFRAAEMFAPKIAESIK